MSSQPFEGEARLADIAAAVREIAMWESHRIHLTQHLVNTGNARDPGDFEFGGWRRRCALLTMAGEMLTVLAPHEEAVRALDPLLR